MNKINFKKSPFLLNAIILSIIAGFTLFVYWGIQNHQFLNFDDDMYVLSNYHVRNGLSWENIKWAFGFNGEIYWHPLTWLSLMLDCHIFGLKSGPLLVENVILHLLNVLLLFLILLRVTGARFKAALIALIFAIHPLNVESVAWMVERKTVLSAFFLMSAIYTYIFYTRNKNKWLYGFTLCLYAVGLMAKPIILISPFLLLILDYWPLKRFERTAANNCEHPDIFAKPPNKFIQLFRSNIGSIIMEKLPFIIISMFSLSVTMASVFHGRSLVTQQLVPMYMRIYNFPVSVIQYLRNIVWPVDLSIFHPFPKIFIILYFVGALSAVILITVLIFITRKKRPWLIAGWLWFLVALSPASGLIQAGLWPGIANRFMYIPMIGILIMVIWEADDRLKGRYSNFLKVMMCMAVVCYFAFLARVQNLYFSNSYSLFKRSLEIAEDNPTALNNIGVALTSLGRHDEATKYFIRGIKLYPKKASFYQNYGTCLVAKGDDINAILYLKNAILLDPNNYGAYLNLGLIESRRGNNAEAAKFMAKAIDVDQDNLDVRHHYGVILVKQGKYEEALSHFLFVIKRDPGNIQARLNLAQVYQGKDFYGEAMAQYQALDKTVTHNKGYIYYGIASVYAQQKQFEECVKHLDMAQKDGFDVLQYLKSDKRFQNFRSTVYYAKFLKTHKTKIN